MDRPPVRLNAQIYEEASAWFIECRAGDLDDSGRREFDRWLRKSPEHVSAYLEVAAIWNEGPTLDRSRSWTAETLIAQGRADPDNVIEIPRAELATTPQALSENLEQTLLCDLASAEGSIPEHVAKELSNLKELGGIKELTKGSLGTWPAPRPQRVRRTYVIAAGVAVLIVAAAALFVLEPWNPTYATALGEQRSVELADGSTVELDSKSKVRVRYSNGERDVDLLDGQALFHVAKDKARPFVVKADGTRVRAVGTQFDVYRREEGTVVTVIEGTVAVVSTPDAAATARGTTPEELSGTPSQTLEPSATDLIPGSRGSAGVILLSAGEQLTVTPTASQKSDHPNIAAVTAWTERRIVFESATLAEVAEEFNRYNRRQLVIEDSQLYDFHISGVFSSTDPESLIRFLRERPGVRVTETESEVRVAKNF